MRCHLKIFEYWTVEVLGYKTSVFEKDKFEYSPLETTLSKAFKQHGVKNVAKSKGDFSYDSKHTFYKFYKWYDEFKEKPLDSKYNRVKEFEKPLLALKLLKRKKEKQLKKERIIKNVDELYEKYYNAYKSDYDTDDELNGAK